MDMFLGGSAGTQYGTRNNSVCVVNDLVTKVGISQVSFLVCSLWGCHVSFHLIYEDLRRGG